MGKGGTSACTPPRMGTGPDDRARGEREERARGQTIRLDGCAFGHLSRKSKGPLWLTTAPSASSSSSLQSETKTNRLLKAIVDVLRRGCAGSTAENSPDGSPLSVTMRRQRAPVPSLTGSTGTDLSEDFAARAYLRAASYLGCVKFWWIRLRFGSIFEPIRLRGKPTHRPDTIQSVIGLVSLIFSVYVKNSCSFPVPILPQIFFFQYSRPSHVL